MREYILSMQKQNIQNNKKIVFNIKAFNLAYKDFNLKVPDLSFLESSIYLLLGNNGTGKTSFLKSIAGLNKEFSKDNMKYLSAKERAKFISYMPQVYTIPDISVYHFLLHARYPFVKGISGFGIEDFNKVDEVIKYFNIEYLKERIFSSLSGGEQLRVLMARIYVLDSKIILFDEPTSFLDKPSRKEFLKRIQDLKAQGKTLIIVSHDDYLFENVADFNLEIKE